MKSKLTGILRAGIVCMALAVTAGCSSTGKKEKTDGTSEFTGEFVISAKEAAEKIGDENVLFVDARGMTAAEKGTVEGAAVTEWKELSTCQAGKEGDEDWGLVPEPEDLTGRLQALGIDKEKEIIVLAQPEDGWGEDGRIVWELRQAGCENVRMVDGGISALKDIGAPVKGKPGKDFSSALLIEELDKSHDITTEELMAHYEDYKVVDVRTEKEYKGAVLYNEAQGGHLPGAVNIPYTELFQNDGTLKDNQTIAELFADNGISKNDRVVTYCTGGIRSAYVQIVLEMCGYKDTYSYCQSFWRWAVVGEVEKEG